MVCSLFLCIAIIQRGGDLNEEGNETQLDIDDTWSEGPETITVTVVVDKELKYQYYVQDYTNGGNLSSTELSFSGANVQVYNGEKLIKSYNVPMNEKGTRWNVFEIMDGKIVDTSTIR